MLCALALVVVLRGVLPVTEIDTRLLDPSIAAGLLWGGSLWYVGRLVGREGSTPRQLFGLANLLTVFRGGLYAVVGGFAVASPGTALAWVPAVAYGSGVALDKLDGTVARTIGRETDLGERLDMAFDTFGFVVAPSVAVAWGLLPVWYLSLSAARYVYKGGLAYRRRRGRSLSEPPDSDLGRYLAGVQMVFLTVALVPAVPTDPVHAAAPFVLAPSLIVFARDFLVVTGRLEYPR